MLLAGAKLEVKLLNGSEVLTFDGKISKPKGDKIVFSTFDDHRVLMSLAPLVLLHKNIELDYPNAVHKSYPCFWQDLKKNGFTIEQK
jgi:3-phosphoshikimate 1-carboxyvinyltransferase